MGWLKKMLIKPLLKEAKEIVIEELRNEIVEAIRKAEIKYKLTNVDLPEEEIADLIVHMVRGGGVTGKYRLMLREVISSLIYLKL